MSSFKIFRKYKLGHDNAWKRDIGKYTLTLKDNHLYCSCPAWKYQKVRAISRTCKHIKQYYPEYEPQPDRRVLRERPKLALFERYVPQKHSLENAVWTIKYDGVRALWDGKQMVLRSGTVIKIPDDWHLPEKIRCAM